ncbi:MAG TPA: ectonucleotide pyrophosphatase/phosphodiesterase [Kofleriaceae bacterium]|nr:ectonucleotide pyrophosphatase/phosphodiesterase [Kofleriaceae bacterium]
MKLAPLACLLVACGARVSAPRPFAHRLVVVSIDGLMPDAYLDPDAHGLKVPTLRALVAGGASARVRGVMPTVTYPAHTTIVTGVPPRVHGIVSNEPLDPMFTNHDGWRWYAEDVAAPTIYGAVEAAGGRAALVIWPVTVGARASVVVPEYWRAGGPDDQKLLRALATPGVLDDTARATPDLWTHLTPPDIEDAAPFAIARTVLATRAPDLLMVHAFGLDDAQHAHGPWSPEAKATIENADRELGVLLAQLEHDPRWPETTFVVVSDHGFRAIDHELRLPALFAAHDLNGAQVAVLSNGGTAFVYVLDPSKRDSIDAALAELGDHVARRIDHDQLVAMGGDPNASFALVAAPGNGFSLARTGAPVTDLQATRGTHGWPPDDPDMAASFIAFGPGVAHASLGTIDMLDLAPTFARWLGVALPSAQGKPLPIR